VTVEASVAVREVPLGEICEFKYGKALPEASRTSGQFAVYGSNGPVGSHTHALTLGPTVVIGRKGSFGEVHFSPRPCWPIDTTYYVDETATDADIRWLAYRLSGLGLTALNRAAAVPGLNRNDAYRCQLYLPPPSEQRRIADLLDAAGALHAKQQDVLARLDEFAEAMFVEMFVRGSSATEGRKAEPLGNHLQFVTSGGRGWARYYADHGSRFIRSLDVRMNHIANEEAVFVTPPDNAEARRTRVAAGDVLLTITGSRIGRVAAAPKELDGAYISQHVAILRPDPAVLLPAFLAFFLSSELGGQPQIAAAQYGQTKPGLNFEQIRSFELPVPSLRQQEDFARRLVMIEGLRGKIRQSLAQFEALFASLQHRAFRGEL
jgi:type I restriction enzyme S subunit